uniref:CABIT domain-containing protein n=1 Tax=Romanomermis culicivorax TaxID=13658 RepID=A0A915ILC5_ROMCU
MNFLSQNDLIRKATWSLDTHFLSDFVRSHKLPVLAKVTKGQYLNLGVPSANLNPYVLIYSNRKNVQKLIGRLVKYKDGKIAAILDQRVQFSREFSGYFEILSEDGRPTRGLESVQELRDFFPDACIVRCQNFKAYLPGPDGEMTSSRGAGQKTRNLANGEILTLVGLFNFKQEKFLRCFDESGKSVFLKLDDKYSPTAANGQKCKFTPIVTDDDAISGAHRAATLVKKRLPITVRMIAGPMQSHLVGSSGYPVIRIEKISAEDEIQAYSLPTGNSDGQFLKIPVNAHLKLASAINRPNHQYSNDPTFRNILNRCQKIQSNLNDRIVFYKPDFLSNSNSKDSFSSIESKMIEEVDADSGFNDEEIEELYNYIRGAPPPILDGPTRQSRNDQHNLHKSKCYSKSTEKLFDISVVRRDRSSSKNNQNRIKPAHQQFTIFSPLQPLKFWQNYRRGSAGISGYSNKDKNDAGATPIFRSVGETKRNNCSPRAYKSCHNLLEQSLTSDEKSCFIKRQSKFTLCQGFILHGAWATATSAITSQNTVNISSTAVKYKRDFEKKVLP